MIHRPISACTSLVLLSALLVVPRLCGAQEPAERVELIVGVNPSVASPVRAQLQKSERDGPAEDSLFAGVTSVASIGKGASSGRSKTGESATAAFTAYRLSVRDSTAFRALRARWKRQQGIRYVHGNYTFEVHSRPSRPAPNTGPVLADDNVLADSLDHLDVVRALDAWGVTTGGADIEIGVIDTGFYLEHPDLAPQFSVSPAEDVNGNGRFDPVPASEGGDLNGKDDDGNGYVDDVIGYDFVDRRSPILDGEYEDRDGDPSADPKGGFSAHGTAVAGVAASAPGNPQVGIAGVAPGTEIVALRAFGGDGRGESDDIAAAIVYAAAEGVDVLNLSFGRDRPVPLIEDAIQFANAQGTVVVASAGNDLTDDPHYPSDYPSVLSVVWLAEDGEGLPQFNRSQFGIGVDIGAPGSNVYTTTFPADRIQAGEPISRNDRYQSVNGSSFSAPQVAGAAALVRSVDSTLSPASVRSILTGTAADLEDENWDHTTGAGRLDAAAALARSYPARTEIDTPSHNDGLTSADAVPVTGSAVDPAFASYALYYARGTRNFDTRTDPWTEITPKSQSQVLRDTLGIWDVSALDEGNYTLRLVTRLRDGRTIEDRRRVIIDRSAPILDVNFFGTGRVKGEHGIIADLETDDRTRVTMSVRLGSHRATVDGEYETRRHGVSWPNTNGLGGTANVEITVTNTAGLTTSLDTSVVVPPDRENTALFQREKTEVPRGSLLPHAPDFDDDGLREVVLNQANQGGLSDTLRSFEWTGTGFAPADTLIATLFPKDLGDTNEDGLQELLLQVRGATLLLEQNDGQSFPDQLAFADTTGISNQSGEVLNGAALTDLDSDGRGEVVGTNGDTWRIFERSASGFDEVLRLGNPTSLAGRDSALGNAFDTPEALSDDFDGDGNVDLLVGDRDGDIVVYESTGDDTMAVAWTHETERVDAGNRFGSGDMTGDGAAEFVTMTTYPRTAVQDGEYAPKISYYNVWRSTGDDKYARDYRLPIVGPYTDRGAITTADFDDDGRAEIAIAHPPSLLLLDRSTTGTWIVLREDRQQPSIQTRKMVAADFSGNGHPSLMAETVGEHLGRYVVPPGALLVTPPRWTRARPLSSSSVQLEWRAPGADSVRVYAGPPGQQLQPVTTTTDSTQTISGTETRRFALRAWENGTASPLSTPRTLRPHAPGALADIHYPTSSSVRLTFTEPLADDVRAEQFVLHQESQPPSRILRVDNGRSLDLQFRPDVAGKTFDLEWTGVYDEDGLLLGDTSATVSFPKSDRRTLHITQSEILDQRRVRLTFSDPLKQSSARDVERYTVRPRGRVVDVTVDADSAETVILRLDGLVIGASGKEASLTVNEMVSTDGNRIAKEGRTVRLTRPADDLSNVFVYPNPYRLRSHGSHLTIAGLPQTATVRIYTPDGRLVDVLSVENNRDGGTEWDLRDRRGERVPSGVYLIRVNAPNQSPVLKKAGIIQ